MIPFREVVPTRSCTKKFSTYRRYKPYLATDFNSRCGYTDSHHKWFGGISTFHIDHFLPHSMFPALKAEYSNLVYACSYVNILKSNDDPINYLDPCATDYNQHFFRDGNGRIHPKSDSPRAIYMYKKLKLGLVRYQVIWLLEKCDKAMRELAVLAKSLPNGSEEERAVLKLHLELSEEFRANLAFLTE
ncbi:HNH endonuclease domain-containing protein [Achromobacter xylosoxidans]|uniref:HNH endonuclease domain-containing protein n=1 Tax=Alcaligenes xylosoxydans xylosoxydans TaxID=85698 RepID=UPI000A6C86D0|nr:HNH endonuclease domain-containing protein [Achromobacter xylosoxidans]QQE58951.1 hypothetical protein I6H41_08125 [Achromobacter xylosoxidans]QQV12695.1 hypothetical protein I6I48_23245 [Achromobacter xylosoxidans]UXL02757.1 hypothetical protein N4T34_17930 [Achromobacter xylosoxidans]